MDLYGLRDWLILLGLFWRRLGYLLVKRLIIIVSWMCGVGGGDVVCVMMEETWRYLGRVAVVVVGGGLLLVVVVN